MTIRNLFSAFLLTGFIACAWAGPARAALENYPSVKLQSLNKVTARTMTFEVKVGATVKFGEMYIKVQSCRKAPPIDPPESAAFLQVWEVVPKTEESQWVFSGWMFASSPALSPMDHPIYDVWVLDCLSDQGEESSAASASTGAAKSSASASPATSSVPGVSDAGATDDADIPVEEPPPSEHSSQDSAE